MDLHSKILDAPPCPNLSFCAIFWEIWQNRMLAPPGLAKSYVGAPWRVGWHSRLREILDPPLLVHLLSFAGSRCSGKDEAPTDGQSAVNNTRAVAGGTAVAESAGGEAAVIGMVVC